MLIASPFFAPGTENWLMQARRHAPHGLARDLEAAGEAGQISS
jgi:hypothetical protein